MKFEDWLASGPLADETLSLRERIIAQVAFNEGQAVQLNAAAARLGKILEGPKEARAS